MAVFASVCLLSFLLKTERVGVNEGYADVFSVLVLLDRGLVVGRLVVRG